MLLNLNKLKDHIGVVNFITSQIKDDKHIVVFGSISDEIEIPLIFECELFTCDLDFWQIDIYAITDKGIAVFVDSYRIDVEAK